MPEALLLSTAVPIASVLPSAESASRLPNASAGSEFEALRYANWCTHSEVGIGRSTQGAAMQTRVVLVWQLRSPQGAPSIASISTQPLTGSQVPTRQRFVGASGQWVGGWMQPRSSLQLSSVQGLSSAQSMNAPTQPPCEHCPLLTHWVLHARPSGCGAATHAAALGSKLL